MDGKFLEKVFAQYKNILSEGKNLQKMVDMKRVLLKANSAGGKVIFAGNGASASISSHVAIDFTKQAGIRSINFNESNLITAFSNDYGYEHWISRALHFYSDPGDVIVLISSSGSSPNIVNAAKYAKDKGNIVITFSGFSRNNPLKQNGDINFWVDSKGYNIIENIHQIWLLAVCDLIIGKTEYSVCD